MDKQLFSQIEPARHRSLIICFISIIAGLIVYCHKPQQTDGTESDDEIASEGMIPKTNLCHGIFRQRAHARTIAAVNTACARRSAHQADVFVSNEGIKGAWLIEVRIPHQASRWMRIVSKKNLWFLFRELSAFVEEALKTSQ